MPVKLDFDPDGSAPLLPIIYAEIVTMVKNYHDTPGLADDTKSCWVSVNELMELISANKANGIRIYYGRHNPTDKLYPGRHNVILVSTFDAENPQNPTSETSVDQLNYTAPALINSVSYSGQGGDAIPLCPPRCPPGAQL